MKLVDNSEKFKDEDRKLDIMLVDLRKQKYRHGLETRLVFAVNAVYIGESVYITGRVSSQG